MPDLFSRADWEEYAECYDALLHLDPYQRMLAGVCNHLKQLRPRTILDASCGTGNLPLALSTLELEHSWSLVGVDTAETMLTRARTKCSALTWCKFEEVNLDCDLPFDDSSFTQVVSLNTLYAVESPLRTLREFHRVLEIGGRVLVVTPRHDYENGMILYEHCASEKPPEYWAGLHDDSAREEALVREAITDESVVAALLKVARINRAIARSATHHFFTTSDLIGLVESGGFSVERCERTYAEQDHLIIAQKRS